MPFRSDLSFFNGDIREMEIEAAETANAGNDFFDYFVFK
jgi:hypothetical protein